MPRPAAFLPACATALLLGACGAAGNGSVFAVRDSAGVTIAESAAPAWGAEDGWRVAAEPTLDIGGDGGAGTLLDGVLGARRLPDGRVVVVDGGSATLRWFSPAGDFLFERGGWGGGPAEFEVLSGPLASPGPEPLVVQSGPGRYALFSADGERTEVRLPPSLPFPEDPVRTQEGDWLAWTRWRRSEAGVPERYPRTLVRVAADGSMLDTVAVVPDAGATGATYHMQIGTQFLSLPHVVFGGQTDLEVVGGEVVVATAVEREIRFLDPSGALRRVVRWAGPELDVSAADRSGYVDFMVERARSRGTADLAGVRTRAEASTFAERRPAHGPLRADPDGRLWLRQVNPPGVMDERYTVLDADGRLLGEVAMPPGFRTFQIGPDWVLGLWRDALDVEHVRLYALEKA